MKKRYMNENVQKSGIYSQRSERSSSSNVLQELNQNRAHLLNLLKKPIRQRLNSQDSGIETSQLDIRQYKQQKIEQLKIQLQNLKQNFDQQSKDQLNFKTIIEGTISQLQGLKNQMIPLIEQPWPEIVKMERDIIINEQNVIKQMPIHHFNEIYLNHQLGILELTAQQQKACQQQFWITQLNLVHETFIRKNQMISEMLRPRKMLEIHLEQKIDLYNMDIEFDQVMSSLATDEYFTRLTHYLEQQQVNYILFINEENYKKAYLISRKICILLQQSVKLLCLKLSNQLTFISDIKDMVILILDDHRPFSNMEIQQLFEFKLKIRKNEQFLDQEGKRRVEYLEDHLFLLACFVNNIGSIEVLRKKIDIGLNCLCRALLIRQFMLSNHLYAYQYTLIQLNICVVLKIKQQYQQAISLMTFPMNQLECMIADKQTHNFLIKNKSIFLMTEYYINHKRQIPYPMEIPPMQLTYALVLGYAYYATIFASIEKKQGENECNQYYNKVLEEYKKMHPHGFKMVIQYNEKQLSNIQSPRNLKTQQQQLRNNKPVQEIPENNDDEQIVFYENSEENKFQIAMNIREDCLEIIIYSLEYAFTRKMYIKLQDLKGDYKNSQTFCELYTQIEVVDVEQGQFDIVGYRWYDSIGGCMRG